VHQKESFQWHFNIVVLFYVTLIICVAFDTIKDFYFKLFTATGIGREVVMYFFSAH
jgi:hypothetical protein